MTSDSTAPGSNPSLNQALNEYLQSLKQQQREADASFLSSFLSRLDGSSPVEGLTGSRVESAAEDAIRPNDPAAPERVAAIKRWFQYLKKKGYTGENFGIHVRVRRMPGRSRGATRSRLEATPIEMTHEGMEQVRAELQNLKDHQPDLVRAISVAREDKDFRENAPLDAAREALGYHEGRVRELEDTLRRAVVAESAADGDKSSLGSVVRVCQVDTGKVFTYTLVNAREANASEQRISVDSPVGRQLLGRREGDEVVVEAPSRVIHLRIESVSQG